jgi:hypothetical protein
MSFPGMKRAGALLVAAVLSACGGGGGGSPNTEAVVSSVTTTAVLEGDSGTSVMSFIFTLDKPSAAGTSIPFTLTGTAKAGGGTTGSATGGSACGAGVDFITPALSAMQIARDASSIELRVTICGDTQFEPNESLVLAWTGPAGGSGSTVGLIINDDAGGLNGTAVAGTFGRDSLALTNGDADGRLGFSFAKVPSAADWRCTRDNVTGLLWENKVTATGNVHDPAQTFAWAQLNAFVATANAEALCGFSDWRVPTPEEMSSLVDAATATAPTIDLRWFPGQQSGRYWTSTSYRDGVAADAWFVDFATGTVAVDNKTRASFARLVSRGGTTAPAPLPTACNDTTRFTSHGDGTISDKRTGLMWKQCAEGAAGATCTGSPAALSWSEAVARPAVTNADRAATGLGYGDWRLPTRNELSSIAEREQCFNPAINTTAFPAGEPVGFWTATPYALNASLAWSVDFFDGQVAPGAKSGVGSASKRVRLVRAGQ